MIEIEPIDIIKSTKKLDNNLKWNQSNKNVNKIRY